MKIEIWSDFVCPFCYIGEKKLIEALKLTDKLADAEIIFNSFELDPNAKEHYSESIDLLMAKKYGISQERAKDAVNNIVAVAKEVGLDFNYNDVKPTNTFKAHKIAQYAKTKGKLKEFTEKVMDSYFVKSLNISNDDLLVSLAVDCGLNSEECLNVLQSDLFEKEVRLDEQNAIDRGIRSVPNFLFNNEISVSGAQGIEVFVDVINKITDKSSN